MSSCGTGGCGTVGVIACVGGRLVDSCVPGAGQPSDTTCNNVNEDCDGAIDEDFVPTASNCGVGACARVGTITCVSGSAVNSCVPGPRGQTDASCNGQDDDCDGRADEDYVPAVTSCGVGACTASGMRTCSGGTVRDSCVARTPLTSSDDAFAPGNGIDDDCDGQVDEDVPACNTTPRTFEAGAYANVAIPGRCRSVTVRLWGGGGAGGADDGLSRAQGGSGGPGGYVLATALVTTPLHLYVGTGASNDCNAPGTNAGSASYNGGAGGSGAGDNGQDGAIAGGGNGGSSSTGSGGGRGYFGGGGGGAGDSVWFGAGSAGGGGAASVLTMNGVRAAVSGGGGGGGGGAGLPGVGAGGAGGSGCGRVGQGESSGGGGGGGGMCQGGTTQAGSGVNPAFSGDIPSGRGRGGASSCGAGGAGYAILTFAP